MPEPITVPEQLAIARTHIQALEAQATKQSLRTLEDNAHIEVLENEVETLLEMTAAAEELEHKLSDQLLVNVLLQQQVEQLLEDRDKLFEQMDELVAEVAFFTGEKERLQDAYTVLDLELQKQVADNKRITAIMNELNGVQDRCAAVTHLLSEVRSLIRPHTRFMGQTVLRAIIPPVLRAEIDEALG